MEVPRLLAPFVTIGQIVYTLVSWGVTRYILRRKLPKNTYLSGNFAPVSGNLLVDAKSVKVTGSVPEWLSGMYVRNGGNPQFPSENMPFHWFDGDGYLHAVHLKKGKVLNYRGRFVETPRYLLERAAGKRYCLRLAELVTLPGVVWYLTMTLLGKIGIIDPKKWFALESANTAVVFHAKKFLALVEAGKPAHVVLPDLDTKGLYDYEGKLKHPFTAHPKVDTRVNKMYTFGYSRSPFVDYSVISAAGQLVKSVRIPLKKPVMMHDFAVSEHYAIICNFPLQFTPDDVFKRPGSSSYQFRARVPTTFGLIDRDEPDVDKIQWFTSPSCYMFHSANAWEEGDEVVLVGCRSETTDVLGLDRVMDGSPMPEWNDSTTPYMYQWRFNIKTGEVHEYSMSDIACEFPQINQAYLGHKVRYVYAGQIPEGETMMETTLKFDLETGDLTPCQRAGKSSDRLRHGEFSFVARPGSKDEDDGVLVGYVHNETTDKSHLSIIDAQSMREIGAVHLPRRVPYGFHGTWVSQEDIDSQA